MIHYHGTPITPRDALYKMAGRNFCVSFASPSDAKTCLAIGQSVMFDNGAFSAYTKGKPFEPQKYYLWLEDKIGHPHWAVIPDVIGGNEHQQRSLLLSWPYCKRLGVPVWHLNMEISYLLYLIDHYDKVCFGSAGEYWQVGSDKWERRIDAAFNALSYNGQIPWVHMLRGLSQAGRHWPFASADSTNVARNYKDYKTCPEKMASRIDRTQCPVGWVIRPEQAEFADV